MYLPTLSHGEDVTLGFKENNVNFRYSLFTSYINVIVSVNRELSSRFVLAVLCELSVGLADGLLQT